MTAYVDGPVRVSVPATSANLGPGFDSLGLALAHRDRLEAVALGPAGPGGPSVEVEVRGEGAATLPRGRDHLVVQAMEAAFAALGVGAPDLRLTCHNVIPQARGMGSSSAAIVGGLGLARALVPDGADRLDDDALLAMAARIEGHPDNVAPALLGGFVVSGHDDGVWWAVPAPVDPRVRAVVLVPPDPVPTELARGLLPTTVPLAEAAADAGRTALLVAALGGSVEHLWRGTRDHLHQEHRRPAMPATLEMVDRLRARGVAAAVSGAGPTVIALVTDEADSASVLADAPEGWGSWALDVDPRGLVVEV